MSNFFLKKKSKRNKNLIPYDENFIESKQYSKFLHLKFNQSKINRPRRTELHQ